MRALWILAFLYASTGCGFMLTQGPPAGHQQMNYFSCTESKVGPGIDLVWAGLNIAGAVLAASDDTIEDRDLTVASGVLWGIFSTASGFVGIGKADECREAKALLANRLAGVGPQPAPNDRGWVPVASWSGSGNRATGAFHIDTHDWRVTWTATNPGYGAFMYIAVQGAGGEPVIRGAEQRGAGGGQLYVGGAGDYSLEIVAVNLDWNVRVEER